MPCPGEYHRYPVLIRGLDDLVVLYGAARLDDGGYAVFPGHVHVVPEREEGVGGEDRALDGKTSVIRLHYGYPRGIYPRRLSGPDADGGRVSGDYYGVALDVLADGPGEYQVLKLLFVRPPLGNGL